MHWAEISSEEDDKVIVDFYEHPTEKCWTFTFEEPLGILKRAKAELLEERIFPHDS
jgi:hypothetical protein